MLDFFFNAQLYCIVEIFLMKSQKGLFVHMFSLKTHKNELFLKIYFEVNFFLNVDISRKKNLLYQDMYLKCKLF